MSMARKGGIMLRAIASAFDYVSVFIYSFRQLYKTYNAQVPYVFFIGINTYEKDLLLRLSFDHVHSTKKIPFLYLLKGSYVKNGFFK